MRAPLLAPSLHVALALAVLALPPATARAQCAPLVPAPGYLVGSCSGTAVGDTCSVSCAPGYWGSAVSSVCQANGTWSAFSGCTVVTCPAATPPTGYTLSCQGTTYGDTCTVACADGSGYVGAPSPASIACGGGGLWAPAPGTLSGCALATCPAPSVPTGYDVTCAGGTSFGAACAITCATGYVGLPVNATVTCGLGVWSPIPDTNWGCALADCGAPAPRAGYALSCPATTYGSACAVTCDAASGYVGTPSAASLTCLASQAWSTSTASLSGCALATCPAPTVPTGYAASCAGAASFGDACTISCATGYVGTPATTGLTCGLAGWSANPAVNSGCAPVDCGAPTIPGADVSGCAAHARYGEGACTPPCTEGHSGSPSATCTAAGSWAIAGGCSPIPCWPSPGTNGDSCGTGGQACLSGSCAVPAAGQVCTTPFTLSAGVERSFPLDGQHDLLAATRCPDDLEAGKDVFVEFVATARRYRVDASADGAAGLDAVALASCAATACAAVDAQAATSTTLVATVEPASAGTVVLAVHVRGAPAGATARVTVTHVPDAAPGPPSPPSPPGGSGCGCTAAAAPAAWVWSALALALAPPAWRRRPRHR